MPRAPWEGWAHFSDYSGTDPKHPHKCRSCGKVLPDDAVVARKHLAFHCSSFAESEVLSREGYVLSFVGTKTKLTQEEESAKNTVLKQRGKRPAEGDAEDVEGKNEVCASAPGVCENVFLPDTVAQLRRAHDMPAFRWCKLYGRTCRVADLFRIIVSPLVSLPSVADKVEHGNSTYKWVQTGRVTLKSETARKLVYIIMNLRALKDHRECVAAVYKPGQFQLGWGWRPTSRDASSVLAVAEVDAEPNPPYAEAASRLAVSVAGLEASLPVAAPEPRRSPRNKLARTGGGGAAAGKGGAGAAAAAPMPAARQLKMITCWTCGFVFQERPPSEDDVDPCGRGDVCKLPQPESEEPAAE